MPQQVETQDHRKHELEKVSAAGLQIIEHSAQVDHGSLLFNAEQE
jgi:hypothetical protein